VITSGKLYIVPTPIGNLEDMTLRAIRILKEMDLILAEDTRTAQFLLKHFEITTRLQSYHMHNEHQKTDYIVEQLTAGKNIALVSDAGTPAISDPGFLLVRAALKENILVECLPGATAFVPALVQSGLPADTFSFYGFLPTKKGRQTKIKQLGEEQKTVIIYESPHRVAKLASELLEALGDRPFSYSREISKMHHTTYIGSLVEAIEHFKTATIKGEYVLVLGGLIHKK